MRRVLFLTTAAAAVAALSVASSAHADDFGQGPASKPWTASFGYGRTVSTSGSAPDSPSYSGSLERRIGAGFVGVAGAYQTRTTTFARAASPVDVSGWSGSAYGGGAWRGADLSLGFDYGEESAEFPAIVSTPGSARQVALSGRNTFTSAGASISRTFGAFWRATPNASVSWTRTTTHVAAASQPALSVSSANSGVSGFFGLDLGRDLGPRVALTAGGGVAASSNTASVYRLAGLRRTTAPQSFGGGDAAAWGEFHLGLSIDAGPVMVSIGGAATAGLPEDTIAAVSSMSFGF